MSAEGRLLIDNSAWARLPAAPPEVAERVAGWVRESRLAVCLPFLLEAGYSARSAGDDEMLRERLLALPYAATDPEVERLALEGQRQLARAGHHRLPPVDLVIAALAHRHGHGILHFDRDYDLLAERTTLAFESVWPMAA